MILPAVATVTFVANTVAVCDILSDSISTDDVDVVVDTDDTVMDKDDDKSSDINDDKSSDMNDDKVVDSDDGVAMDPKYDVASRTDDDIIVDTDDTLADIDGTGVDIDDKAVADIDDDMLVEMDNGKIVDTDDDITVDAYDITLSPVDNAAVVGVGNTITEAVVDKYNGTVAITINVLWLNGIPVDTNGITTINKNMHISIHDIYVCSYSTYNCVRIFTSVKYSLNRKELHNNITAHPIFKITVSSLHE